MTVPLPTVNAEELDALPRPREQQVTQRVGNWLDTLRRAGARRVVLDAAEQYAERDDHTREGMRQRLRDLDDPIARTAVVFLWGGARGRNLPLAVTSDPRRSDPAPWDEGEDRLRSAHEFLWGPDSPPLEGAPSHDLGEICFAFDKLWCRHNRRKAILKGCGTAFGTKVLYWAARRQESFHDGTERVIPLIYDQRVHASLEALQLSTQDSEGTRIDYPHPRSTVPYAAYSGYCEQALEWAQRLNRHASAVGAAPDFLPDDIESWLFALNGRHLDRVPEPPRESLNRKPAGGPEQEEPDAVNLQLAEAEEKLRHVGRVVSALARHAN